jgi:hypothetical protein
MAKKQHRIRFSLVRMPEFLTCDAHRTPTIKHRFLTQIHFALVTSALSCFLCGNNVFLPRRQYLSEPVNNAALICSDMQLDDNAYGDE